MNPNEAPSVINPTSPVIQFNFGLYDLVKCRLWAQYHHKILIVFMLMCSFFVPVMDWNAPQIKNHPLTERVFVFIFTGVTVFCLITFINVLFAFILAATAKNKGLVGTHEIELGPECVTEKTADSAASYRWSAYHKTRRSKNYLFLFVNENNVLYVPKNIFPSTQTMEQFLEVIRSRSGNC
ncbi:MAG TPA: YcxB family protein [Candidatus Sulfotelmatobacter sp.]|jgi:hypothetical protein|nr:YcxB family protein [Candidatus Sulfotelmatobacter sp.]